MKKNLLFAVLTLGVMTLVATGCQKVPQAQLDAAKAAIDSAKTVQADRYFPTEFLAVQDTFNMAVNSIEASKSASMFKRNYKDAQKQLESVKTSTDALIANVETKKQQVKAEAEAAINEVNTLVAEDKELIKKAPKGKEGKAALEAIQQDITLVENTVTAASAELQNGDFLSANDKLKAAKEKAGSIKAELQAAIDKVAKKK
jgi:hypothetical protein